MTTMDTPHLDELARLTAHAGELHEQLMVLGEQHADTRRALAQAEKDLADGGGDSAADSVNRLRARLSGEPGQEQDVTVAGQEKRLRAEHTAAQRTADDYRREHAAALAGEMMPAALAARDDLLEAFHTFQEACRRWDRSAGEFAPLVQARPDLRPDDVPHNPMRDALTFGKTAVSEVERTPHKGIPAPWQAVPDAEMVWPSDRGAVQAGGALRDGQSLRAAREPFHAA